MKGHERTGAVINVAELTSAPPPLSSLSPNDSSQLLPHDRWELCESIQEATGIDSAALLGTLALSEFSVKRRLSWGMGRYTTRREDKAYCMLGIFGVFMPVIYGEGDNAMRRLKDEISKRR
jgi:hypothetical protein